MRNVFDQYSQAENKLTHAFFTALDRDRKLLSSFLKLIGISAPVKSSQLTLTVQSYPFASAGKEFQHGTFGIPDAWIFYGDWALIFEIKVTADLTMKQLSAHRNTAHKLGFKKTKLFAIVATDKLLKTQNCQILYWKNLYQWLKTQTQSEWAITSSTYFEILESYMIENEKLGNANLTTFSGFFESNQDYNYGEAKRLIRLAMQELRKSKTLISKLSMDPKAPGRSAITGSESNSIWDFLQFTHEQQNTAFTNHPHLTLSIDIEGVEASITFPNKLVTLKRNNLKNLNKEGFHTKCLEVLSAMNSLLEQEPGAKPIMRGIQRRYPTQRSKPFVDALIEFDLRTIDGDMAGPKKQSQWIDALFETFLRKNSNFQMQIGVKFSYGRCQTIGTVDALKLIETAWCACAPLLEVTTQKSSP